MSLERFQLSAEDFRLKFVTSQKTENKTWRDFASIYFDQLLSGLEITTYEQLIDLIITYRLKRKVCPEANHHFIDVWSSITTSLELAKRKKN